MTSKKIIIGRSTECDLVLADMTVSRHHAEIELLENKRILLTDCQSTQGTFLISDGQESRVKQKLISEFDTIRFGKITISLKEILTETGISLNNQKGDPKTISPPLTNTDISFKHLARQSTLAKKSTRLFAIILDFLIMLLVCIPGLITYKITNDYQYDNSIGTLIIVLSYLILGSTQLFYLVKHGQSLGKKALGIKIVKIDNEQVPGFATIFLLRSLIPNIISSVPYAGPVFWLIDILFIFRDDRRCMHDLIAQTKVVNVSTPRADL